MSLDQINCCIIIATYNNQNTLKRVIDGVLKYSVKEDVIVINDGSTDNTLSILQKYSEKIIVLSNPKNKGKGFSLRKGFNEAITRGFENAITIDSDGQHYPEDISKFITTAKENPGFMIMGSRNMNQEGVPGKSSFGNKFSNFWFKIETGITLPDTQTGFRLYPLGPIKKINLYTTKFETEIEVIVKLAWKNVKFIPININVLYDPNERVSHFRPFTDFTRISILNTFLVTLTFLYYLPKRILQNILKKNLFTLIRDAAINENESNFKKAISIGFGFFIGIVPIWGFQLLLGIPLAILFRMNKLLFIASANISIPPMIPFIIYLSYYVGGFFVESSVSITSVKNITLETIHINMMQYALGATVLAVIAGLFFFTFFYFLLSILRTKKSDQ
jgi:glycosyltransferase involved in cell wall biosynthesis